jgi:hypothetical protein
MLPSIIVNVVSHQRLSVLTSATSTHDHHHSQDRKTTQHYEDNDNIAQ